MVAEASRNPAAVREVQESILAEEVKMRYFLDTEFIEDGKTIDLISIGIVRNLWAGPGFSWSTPSGAVLTMKTIPRSNMLPPLLEIPLILISVILY